MDLDGVRERDEDADQVKKGVNLLEEITRYRIKQHLPLRNDLDPPLESKLQAYYGAGFDSLFLTSRNKLSVL